MKRQTWIDWREGMAFTDFHVGQSFCSPSRCLDDRLLPPPRRNSRQLRSQFENRIESGEMTIAEVLKQKSYATAMYGKWHLGHLPKFANQSRV